MPLARQWPWEKQGATAQRAQEEALKSHKRDRLKTTFLPLALVAGVALLAVAGTFVASHGAGLHKAASAVVILASALCILGGLPLLAVLGVAIYLTARLTSRVPPTADSLLKTLENTRRGIRRVSHKSASPIIRIRSATAALKAFADSIRQKDRQS